MYVTVSLKMELEATATLSQMESQIQEAGREAMSAYPCRLGGCCLTPDSWWNPISGDQ